MNSKALITLLLSIGFMLWGSWWYNSHFAHLCNDTTPTETAPPPAPVEVKEPLMFKWSDPSTITYDKFPGFQANIMADNAEGKILEITGKYYEGETAPKGYANMGLARAEQIRKLFPDIKDTRIKLLAEKIAVEAD